jgi:uncharacterized membrane protein YdcZ (DUF606 family)
MNRWGWALIVVVVATVVDAYAWRWKDDPRRKWWRVLAWFLVLAAIISLMRAG